MNCDSDADDTETILHIKNKIKGNAQMLSIHYRISDELISWPLQCVLGPTATSWLALCKQGGTHRFVFEETDHKKNMM